MADSPAKRAREAKKREHREMKAERKKLRKAGLLGADAPPPSGEEGPLESPPPTEPPAGTPRP